MRYDRDDDMVITGKRHDFRITTGQVLINTIKSSHLMWSIMPVADGRRIYLCRCGSRDVARR